MVRVIIVDKSANLKCTDVKQFDVETLYKKCNLRKSDNFEKRATWKMNDDYFVSLFSKDKGRASSENKYDLPPPIDKDLYFGSMVLVKHCYKDVTNETAEDFDVEEWNKLYEKLFGGFEDLGEDDSYSEEEEIPEHLQTKQGYSKEDGFVVSDGDVEDEDYIPEEEDEEEEAHSSTDDADDEDGMGKDSEIDDEEEEDEDDEDDYEEEDYESDLGSELSEESYIDSD
tara:strand:- start:1745 stop:2425 length:681 start_codon:yes stop_codon:yes gene_type:complete